MVKKDNFVQYTVLMTKKSNKKGKKNLLHCLYFEFANQTSEVFLPR